MTPQIVDYKNYVRGDTINARLFTLSQTAGGVTSPIDLTGASIRATFVCPQTCVKKTVGEGISIVDATNGQFQINTFSLPIEGKWCYDIEIEFPDGTVKTWIKGTIKILNDVTK